MPWNVPSHSPTTGNIDKDKISFALKKVKFMFSDHTWNDFAAYVTRI